MDVSLLIIRTLVPFATTSIHVTFDLFNGISSLFVNRFFPIISPRFLTCHLIQHALDGKGYVFIVQSLQCLGNCIIPHDMISKNFEGSSLQSFCKKNSYHSLGRTIFDHHLSFFDYVFCEGIPDRNMPGITCTRVSDFFPY